MDNKKNIPTLRFSEFSGEWEAKNFKQLVKLQRGSSPRPIVRFITKSDDGVNWIKIGDTKSNDLYINSTAEKITKKGAEKSRKVNVGEIILSNSMSYGKPYILNIDGYIHDGWFVIRDYEKNLDKVYLRQLLGSELVQKQYKRLAAGGVVSNISSELVNLVKINLPPKQEQQKIANFLTILETKIEQLSKKKQLLESYKKGSMQKIFSQELRFKDDEGKDYPDWEEKKLGDLLDYEQPTKYLVNSTEYSNEYETPVLTAGKTFLLGYTNEDFGFFENVPVIIFDDFTTANKFVDFKFKAKSSAMKMLNKKNDDIDVKFVYEAIQMINFSLGEEHKRYWISEYQKIKIKVPSFPEQTKIANFLTEIDNKINLVEKQLNDSKEYKKGLLQKMFV